jgi:hypothetical protein
MGVIWLLAKKLPFVGSNAPHKYMCGEFIGFVGEGYM